MSCLNVSVYFIHNNRLINWANAIVFLAGGVHDVRACTDELRSACGGDLVGESHMAICFPGKV